MTVRRVVVDHVDLLVSNLEASRRFYSAALAPLGYRILRSTRRSVSYGVEGIDDFGINESEQPTGRAHVAYVRPSRAAVDSFFEQALAAGERPKSRPGFRPQYHAEYYSAYVFDPGGNNIEAVHHGSRSFPQGEEQDTQDTRNLRGC